MYIDTKKLYSIALSEFDDLLKRAKNNQIKLKPILIVCDGSNLASNQYVSLKVAFAQKYGIEVIVQQNIDGLDLDNYGGIIVQLPYYSIQSSADQIISKIKCYQDIDVFNGDNLEVKILPPTINSIIQTLDMCNNLWREESIVVIGGGKLVGAPLCKYLSENNIKHKNVDANNTSVEIKEICKKSDIIISATGVGGLIDTSHVTSSKSYIIIDAGTSEDTVRVGRVIGDVLPEIGEMPNVLLSPTPGGIGRNTVVNLFSNYLALSIASYYASN